MDRNLANNASHTLFAWVLKDEREEWGKDEGRKGKVEWGMKEERGKEAC